MFEEKKHPQRTVTQNASLHKYCTLLSDGMNDAGYDQRMVIEQFKEGFNIPWTMESVKHIFRIIAKAMYDCKSTADLDTVQIQEVYRVFDARMSEITGISIAWPSKDAMIEEARNAELPK